jgi:hypothetical protein
MKPSQDLSKMGNSSELRECSTFSQTLKPGSLSPEQQIQMSRINSSKKFLSNNQLTANFYNKLE